MRVLHLDSGRTARGGQYQMMHLVRALPAQSSVLSAFPVEGVEWAPLTIRNLLRVMRRADVIHCHDANTHKLAAIWASSPFVVSRRVVFPVRTGPLSRWKYRRAAHYLAISQAVAGELRRAGVPEERIAIVPDATELPGQLSTRTGGVVAIESSDPRKGGALLRESGLAIAYSRELREDLPTARAFVYITDSEGLGSAALLAMAYGVPVVASRVGGLPEIVRHEETGLLVDNDAGRIRAAVERILGDEDLAERLARAGRAMVEQRFTIEHMVQGTMAVYRKVLS